jgi:hypothetical protein
MVDGFLILNMLFLLSHHNRTVIQPHIGPLIVYLVFFGDKFLVDRVILQEIFSFSWLFFLEYLWPPLYNLL